MGAVATSLQVAQGIAQAARQAGSDDPDVRGADWQTATVTAVNADGTVDIGSIRARRVSTYQNPLVGDRIFVSRSGNGNWMAIGRTAISTETAFTAYTPTWTSDGTNPSLGNGTLTGRYRKTETGVIGSMVLTVGSTSTLGTGNYFWQLPTSIGASSVISLGTAQVLISGGNRWAGQAVIASADGNKFGVFMPTAAANCALRRLTAVNGSPDGALASGTQVRVTYQYEATP